MNQIDANEFNNNKKQEWNKLLREEVQQNKFMIKRISKNIYNKIKETKELENKYNKNNKENIIENHINIGIQGSKKEEISQMDIDKEKEKDLNKSLKKENVNKNNVIVRKIKLDIISNKYSPSQKNPEEKLISSNNWNDLLKEETLHSKFTIKKKNQRRYQKK
jgi:hypothetical protein